jgi:hypothetical protein
MTKTGQLLDSEVANMTKKFSVTDTWRTVMNIIPLYFCLLISYIM